MQKSMFKGTGSMGPPLRMSGNEKFSPIPYSEFFDEKVKVSVNNGDEVFNVYKKGEFNRNAPVILFLHGGGYSGLTFAILSKLLYEKVNCQVIAPDLRGHGDTVTKDDFNLSAERLCKDVKNLVNAMYDPFDLPPIIVVGHSMGGAIAVHIADGNYIPSLCSIVVIDVVEGTAMAALPVMMRILHSRPMGFESMENAIRWSVRSGQIKNLQSARVSFPGQVCLASENFIEQAKAKSEKIENSFDSIQEVDETYENQERKEQEQLQKTQEQQEFEIKQKLSTLAYTWRTDLTKSEKYWTGWFQGMSKKFLQAKVLKLLFVASVDRLDVDLTVGQMQGKFQIGILPTAGHSVHEDVPDRVEQILTSFLIRNKITTEKNDT